LPVEVLAWLTGRVVTTGRTGVPDRDRRTEDRLTDAERAHNRDQASLPAPRPPTRNSGHLPVRP
jgi:hypothetical protein